MRSQSLNPNAQHSQLGGITIVVALVLIMVMSLAAFSLSRNAIRDLSASGSVLQGEKASQVSDAGFDWFVVWSQPDNATAALPDPTASLSGSATANQKLAKAMYDLTTLGSDWHTALANDGLLASTSPSRTWDAAALIASNETQTGSDQVLDNSTSAAVYQAKNNNGNPIVQRFDLVVRYLGAKVGGRTSTQPGASAGTTAGGGGPGDRTYQLLSTGYAAVPIGNGSYLRYRQQREATVVAPPF